MTEAACTATRHGTRAAYVDGCTCPEARAANTAYAAYRKSRTVYAAMGAADPFTVPVDQARTVVKQLLDLGWTRRRIAAATGLRRDGLSRITGGTTRPVTRVKWDTYRRLRELLERAEPDVAGGTLVDAHATWLRIRGLVALGYPKSWIARQLCGGRALQLHGHQVTARNAEKVKALVDTYGATRGPSAAALRYAAARGWTPDLLWQADDDPGPRQDRPTKKRRVFDVDDIAVDRALAGDPIHLTRAEKTVAVQRILARGGTTTEAAIRLRLSGTTARQLAAAVASGADDATDAREGAA